MSSVVVRGHQKGSGRDTSAVVSDGDERVEQVSSLVEAVGSVKRCKAIAHPQQFKTSVQLQSNQNIIHAKPYS